MRRVLRAAAVSALFGSAAALASSSVAAAPLLPDGDPATLQGALAADHPREVHQLLDHNRYQPLDLEVGLLFAAQKGYCDIAGDLLDHGAPVELPADMDGMTPLIAAISGGHPEPVWLLLQRGADVQRTWQHQTPLFQAVLWDQRRAAQVLLHAGANPNIGGRFGSMRGQSPLERAQSIEMARLLLDHGADPNAVDPFGMTPLFNRALAIDPRFATLMATHGAHMNARFGSWSFGEFSADAVMRDAIERGDRAAFDHAADSEPHLLQGQEGWALLSSACQRGRTPIVARLLSSGAPLLIPGSADECWPLQNAVGAGQPAIVKLLLDAGADVNGPLGNYGSPLCYAVGEETNYRSDLRPQQWSFLNGLSPDYLGVTKLLLSRGANPNLARGNGSAPLNYANEETVDLLLNAGADINAVDCNGQTPLQSAVCENRLAAAQRLAERGANLDFVSACALGRLAEVERMLQARPALATAVPDSPYLPPAIGFAAIGHHADIMRMLIQHGADINAGHPEYAGTAIQHAVEQNDLEAVRLLVQFGANLNVRTEGDSLDERADLPALKTYLAEYLRHAAPGPAPAGR